MPRFGTLGQLLKLPAFSAQRYHIFFSCEATQETAHVRSCVRLRQLAISQLHT